MNFFAEGLRLVGDEARASLPPRSRIVVIVGGTVVSLAATAGAAVVSGLVSESTGLGPTMLAFAIGTFLGLVASTVLLCRAVRRSSRRLSAATGARRRADQNVPTEPTAQADVWTTPDPSRGSRRGASFLPQAPKAPGAWREIRAAYREGREPTSSIADRLAAARFAQYQRLVLPRQGLLGLAIVPFVVPATAFVISESTASVAFLPFYFVLIFARVPGIIWSLGQTTAAIATAPDEAEAPPPRKPKPYRLLGTDHPDDYA